MTVRKLLMLALPIAAVVAGCSSAEKDLANGLIARVLDETSEVQESEDAKFSYTAEGEFLTVKWNKGPLKGTDRTFELVNTSGPIYEYAMSTATEEGYLVAIANQDALFALGAVDNIDSDVSALGAAHFGTAPTNVPTSGVANYEGATAGLLVNLSPNNSDDAFVGRSQVQVNFGTGVVNGSFDQLVADNAGSLPQIFFTGAMNSGESTYGATSIEWGAEAATGTLMGGLYGPGASSTAGVFDITNNGGSARAVGGYLAGQP